MLPGRRSQSGLQTQKNQKVIPTMGARRRKREASVAKARKVFLPRSFHLGEVRPRRREVEEDGRMTRTVIDPRKRRGELFLQLKLTEQILWSLEEEELEDGRMTRTVIDPRK